MNIKDYFAFTRGEKRGSVVLLLIIVILIIGQFIPDILKKSEQTNFTEFESEINAFERARLKDKNTTKQKIEFFEFNPNTISDSAWRMLGFSNWQINNINKYKAKGGNWKTKNDVSKIYGLASEHYKQLKPYILLPESIDNRTKTAKDKKSEVSYFNFNPNTVKDNQWKQLGFSDWQIKNINKYKSKGGKWKTKNDVAKIYGLSNEDYQKLKPYILLPEKTENLTTNSKKDFNKKININTADAKELTNLKGIYSEKYATIIINYRNNLGGFVKKEQLLEVWNMKKETYEGFLSQVELGSIAPKQININLATTDELKKHPYINWNTANAIVKYRKVNGNFTSIKDIKKIHLITQELYSKIAPYLKIK